MTLLGAPCPYLQEGWALEKVQVDKGPEVFYGLVADAVEGSVEGPFGAGRWRGSSGPDCSGAVAIEV